MGGDRNQVLGEKANRILIEMLSNREKKKKVSWSQKTIPGSKKSTIFYYIKSATLFYLPWHLEMDGVHSKPRYTQEERAVLPEAFCKGDWCPGLKHPGSGIAGVSALCWPGLRGRMDGTLGVLGWIVSPPKRNCWNPNLQPLRMWSTCRSGL